MPFTKQRPCAGAWREISPAPLSTKKIASAFTSACPKQSSGNQMRQLTAEQLELAREFGERKRSLRASEWALQWFGALTFGIESVSVEARTMRYVNTGETYDQTIVREGSEY